MEFHPQKCQVFHITSKRKPVKFLYNIHSQTLEEAKTANYLGVTIQNDLIWNKHIDATTKKANNTRPFQQRNIKQCPGKTKELYYKTLIRPIQEYASVIWNRLVDIPSSHLTPTLSVRGHSMKFMIPYARTFTYQRSFFPDTIPSHHQNVEQPSPRQ